MDMSRRAAVLTTLMTPPGAALAVAAPSSSPPVAASPAEWGYADSANGPLAWGSLKNPDGTLAYPDCGCRACAQSPINLPSKAASPADSRVGTLGDVLVPPDKPTVLSVAQKHGTPNFTAVDTVSGGGAVVAGGVTHRFASLHFRTQAEITVDGVAYPMVSQCRQ